MEDMASLVARQYDAYAYPEPFSDLTQKLAEGYFQFGDPALYAPMLWPEGKPRERLRILAAGCGTIQAAYLAFTNPSADVTGVDVSESALAHERFLQDRHGLSNLRLFKGDLRDVGALGDRFDAVICSGVLHHLQDPAAGLRALREVLAPAGVMVLMLYAAARRAGVYMLQDVFRRMQIKQDAAGVARVRRILAQVPAHHYVHWYVKGARELEHDAALVDTFLHPVDRAYTVPEVLSFVESNGLAFHGWIDNASYYPPVFFAPDSEIGQALAPLAVREQWAAVEALTLKLGTHVFLARLPEAPLLSAEAAFADGSWEKLIPHWSPGGGRAADGTYNRSGLSVKFSEAESLLLGGIDGVRTAGELAHHPRLLGYSNEARTAFARQAFAQAWRLGNIMLSRVPYPRSPAAPQ